MSRITAIFSFVFGIALLWSGCDDVSQTENPDTAEQVMGSDQETDGANGKIDDTERTGSAQGGTAGDETPGSEDNGTVQVLDGGVAVTEPDGTTVICFETICDGRLLECGDCRDNDGDGKSDARDRECLGPCDNTEGPALISDVGWVTGSTCHVDCYFDYGNGMGTGSDDCWWDHQCDPLEPEQAKCPYDEKVVRSQKFCPDEQSALCDEICLPFTPNGCDCFGCCTFPELNGEGPDGTDGFVWIGAKDEGNNGICTFRYLRPGEDLYGGSGSDGIGTGNPGRCHIQYFKFCRSFRRR